MIQTIYIITGLMALFAMIAYTLFQVTLLRTEAWALIIITIQFITLERILNNDS